MSGSSEFEAAPAVAANLARLGWSAADAAADDALPVAARGANLIVAVPPGVAWTAPLLATLLSRLDAASGRMLVLSPPGLLQEWGHTLAALVAGSSLECLIAQGVARAERRLASGTPAVLVADPATALALQARSALHSEQLATVVFAWPERWQDESAIAALGADLPRSVQRVAVTSDAPAVTAPGGLGERYLHRAAIFGDTPPSAPCGPVRTVPTSWTARAATLVAVVETLDREAVTVWTADRRDHASITASLTGSVRHLEIVTRDVPAEPSTEPASVIICYDPPTPEALCALCAAGDVVVLEPPGTEPYVARVAAPRRPLVLPSALAAQLERDADRRGRIAAVIATGPESGAFYALAPLFEVFEPQSVAAALWQLWQPGESVTASMPAPLAATGGDTAKVWVSAGRRDNATVADLVAVLVREAGLDRALIGRVDVRDTFSLIEVPAADADRIARALVGKTIRRRKLAARIDRGRNAHR